MSFSENSERFCVDNHSKFVLWLTSLDWSAAEEDMLLQLLAIIEGIQSPQSIDSRENLIQDVSSSILCFPLNGLEANSNYESQSPFCVVVAVVAAVFAASFLGHAIMTTILRKCNFVLFSVSSISTVASSSAKLSFLLELRKEFVREWQEVARIESGNNIHRVVEVCGLGLIVGSVFLSNGNSNGCSGAAMISLLLFFTVTLWTFTRMHTAVASARKWRVRTLQRMVDGTNGDTDIQAVVAAAMVNSF